MDANPEAQRQHVRELLHRARTALAAGGEQAKAAFEVRSPLRSALRIRLPGLPALGLDRSSLWAAPAIGAHPTAAPANAQELCCDWPLQLVLQALTLLGGQETVLPALHR